MDGYYIPSRQKYLGFYLYITALARSHSCKPSQASDTSSDRIKIFNKQAKNCSNCKKTNHELFKANTRFAVALQGLIHSYADF